VVSKKTLFFVTYSSPCSLSLFLLPLALRCHVQFDKKDGSS
jgi:hypothetical protein